MSVQSCICQVSIKNYLRKFLTLKKMFPNFDSTIAKVYNCNFFVNITLCMEVAVNITLSSQSSITITCFNHVAHKHSSKKVKGVLAV